MAKTLDQILGKYQREKDAEEMQQLHEARKLIFNDMKGTP